MAQKADPRWILGKGLQMAGLAGCPLALYYGVVLGGHNAMTFELTALGISAFCFIIGNLILKKSGTN